MLVAAEMYLILSPFVNAGSSSCTERTFTSRTMTPWWHHVCKYLVSGGSSWMMCSFTERGHAHGLNSNIKSGRDPKWLRFYLKTVLQEEQNWRSCEDFSPHLQLSFIFFPASYLFVAECISLTSLAVCVLLTWIALLLLNVFWLGVEKGIVSCCQSTRLQLRRILIAHPPKISRWLLTSPARRIWRFLIFFFSLSLLFERLRFKKTQHERQNWKTKSEFDSTKLLSTIPHSLCNLVDTQIIEAEDNQTRYLNRQCLFILFVLQRCSYCIFSTTVLCSPVKTPTELSAQWDEALWGFPPSSALRGHTMLTPCRWSQLTMSLLLHICPNQTFCSTHSSVWKRSMKPLEGPPSSHS